MGDVLDEDAFALMIVSTRTNSWRLQQCAPRTCLSCEGECSIARKLDPVKRQELEWQQQPDCMGQDDGKEESAGHAVRLAPNAVRDAHLFIFLHDIVKDGLVCRALEAALGAGLLVFLVSVAKSLGTEVEGIAKRLVDALQGIALSHEDLLERVSGRGGGLPWVVEGNALARMRSSML